MTETGSPIPPSENKRQGKGGHNKGKKPIHYYHSGTDGRAGLFYSDEPPTNEWIEMSDDTPDQDNLLKLEAQLAELTQAKGHKDPEVVALREQVKELKQAQNSSLPDTDAHHAALDAAELETRKSRQRRHRSRQL